MYTRTFVWIAVAALAGCGTIQRAFSPDAAAPAADVAVATPDSSTVRPPDRPTDGPSGEARMLGESGLTAAAFDTTTEAERVAAVATPSAATGALGETLASLGSPAETGFWLRTGLVDAPRPGRVELVEGSGAVNLELRPSGREAGSGSQLSLAAFQALGLPLTALPRLRVLAQ